MRILFNFASRSRPQQFLRCVQNIICSCKSDNYQILAKLDFDDLTMNNIEMQKEYIKYPMLKIVWGKSISKIHAINRDIDKSLEWDILVNTSDDMWFMKRDFDDVIRKDMLPSLDIALHYNDGRTNGRTIMTMSILGKKYYDRFKYIYHPDYKSFYCDNEATIVAQILDKYKYSDERLFEHLHPTEGYGEYDEQYKLNDSNWQHDSEVFNKRFEKTFYI